MKNETGSDRASGVEPRTAFAGPGEYPKPETEHGRELSRRLKVGHGLDFDRSIWNIEAEAALRHDTPEETGGCVCCEEGYYCRHRCPVHPKAHGLDDSGKPWALAALPSTTEDPK